MQCSGFRLHAVSTCSSRHGSKENQNTNQFVRVRLLSALINSPNNCQLKCPKKVKANNVKLVNKQKWFYVCCKTFKSHSLNCQTVEPAPTL